MNNRLKILKNLYITSLAQTTPQSGPNQPKTNTEQEATNSAQKPQTGPATAPPQQAPKPQQPVAPASKDFAAKGAEPAKPAATTEANDEKKEASSLYGIVKEALFKKLYDKAIEHYSYDLNQFKAKTIFKGGSPLAVKKINKEALEVRYILSAEALENMVKTGAISFYEPVREYTDFFRIRFTKSSKKEDLPHILIIAKKINNLGFDTTLKKSRVDGTFILECSSLESEKTYETKDILKKAENLTRSIIGTDLSDLVFGKLKRCAFSLDDLGNDDIKVEIGE